MPEWGTPRTLLKKASNEHAMPRDRNIHSPRTLPGAGLLLGLLLAFFLWTPASAQVAALVNGDPITNVDIAQRIKLLQLFSHKTLSRKEALEELIDEKVKLHTAKRLNIDITEKEIDSSIFNMTGRSSAVFIEGLKKEGLDPSRFRSRMRAELAWRKVLEQTSPGTFQIRDADLVAILHAHGENPETRAIQYTLQPIILVVARKAPDSVKAARLKEAEAFRSRVQGCEDAVAQARQIPETVVKDQLTKFSLDLSMQYRKLLDSIPDGKMTPTEVTAAGMEVVMICSRKEVVADISSRREFRQELLKTRLDKYGKDYLAKLRSQSVIEYR